MTPTMVTLPGVWSGVKGAQGLGIIGRMELMAALDAYRGLERRSIDFYRTLAERFAGDESGRVWRETMNTEAAHHAAFALALDWAQLSAEPKPEVPVDPEELEREAAALAVLEAAAARPDLTLADAVELAVAWEERELPRVLVIAPHAPGRGRAQLRAIAAEAGPHYDALAALAREAGADELLPRLDALRGRAREATG